MPASVSFDYAVWRVVPDVRREEFVNVGVILFCPELNYLGARAKLSRHRLMALTPELELEPVEEQLAELLRVAEGRDDAAPLSRLSASERFHWLTSPRSTTLQVSPVHCGLTTDPEADLERILHQMVL